MPNPWKLTSIALATMLAFNTAGADVQPKMRDAHGHLQAALTALQNASSDKGGHRVKAINLTKSAIEQVEKGIKFDNKH